MSEISKKSKVVALWKSKGASVEPISANRLQSSGQPDLWVIWKGCSFFVEFKDISTKVKLNQTLRIRDIDAHGGFACVLRFTAVDGIVSIELSDGGTELHVTIAESLDLLQMLCMRSSVDTWRRLGLLQ